MAISARRWGRRGTPPIDLAPKRELYLHHTVTSNRPRSRAEERRHMRELEDSHLARGFLTIGYNFVLFRSGRLYEGRGPRALPAAQGGHNTGTVAIACVGDYRTDRADRPHEGAARDRRRERARPARRATRGRAPRGPRVRAPSVPART
jgi:hypothetical protein